MNARFCAFLVAILFNGYACAQQQVPESSLDVLATAKKPIESIDDQHYACDSILKKTRLESGKTTTFSSRNITKARGANLAYGSYVTTQVAKGTETHSFNSMISLNSRYIFKAERSKTSDAWILVKVARNDDLLSSAEPELVKIVSVAKKRPFEDLFSIPLRVGDTTAHQLNSLPKFTLVSFVESSNRRRLTIEFSCASSSEDLLAPLSKCWVIYDLDQFGIPVEFSERIITANNLYENNVNNSFQKTSDNSYARTVNRKLVYKTGNTVTYSDETEANPVYTFGKLPESEFTCTAFGLPEPPGYEPKPTPIYVWVLAIAVILFGLAILFRYLAKRKNLG